MQKSRISIIILSLIIIGGIAAAAVLFWPKQAPQTETIPTGEESSTNGGSPGVTSTPRPASEILNDITKQEPSLLDANQQPIFGIVDSKRTAGGWYVVTIINTKDPTVGKAKIIMKEDGKGGLTIVAGPGTNFDRDSFSFPEEV